MRLLKLMTGIFSSDVSCGDRVGSTSEDELDAPEGRLALSHMPRDRLQALKQSGVHHRDLRIIVAHTILILYMSCECIWASRQQTTLCVSR